MFGVGSALNFLPKQMPGFQAELSMDIWRASGVGIPGSGDQGGLGFGHIARGPTATLLSRSAGAGRHRTVIITAPIIGPAVEGVAIIRVQLSSKTNLQVRGPAGRELAPAAVHQRPAEVRLYPSSGIPV